MLMIKIIYTPALVILFLAVASCVAQEPSTVVSNGSSNDRLTFVAPPIAPLNQQSTKTYQDVWSRMRDNTGIFFDLEEPRIVKQRARYLKHPHYFKMVSERAKPYAHYIINEVQRRGMPSEIALLPFLESAYKVDARSPLGAEGLWQFMPATAEHLEMTFNASYDARRDIVESTENALNYLQWLNSRVDNDWLLTMAAYNAGLGTVKKAIKKNLNRNKPTTFWDLKLPKETMNYVPHLLALQSLVDAPDAYGVQLANIPNKPYFASIRTEAPVQLDKVADYLETNKDELLSLNAGYKRGRTLSKGETRILIPAKFAIDLTEEELVKLQVAASAPTEPSRHTVKAGDTVSEICALYDISVSELKKLNKLKSNKIRKGQTLLIPATAS